MALSMETAIASPFSVKRALKPDVCNRVLASVVSLDPNSQPDRQEKSGWKLMMRNQACRSLAVAVADDFFAPSGASAPSASAITAPQRMRMSKASSLLTKPVLANEGHVGANAASQIAIPIFSRPVAPFTLPIIAGPSRALDTQGGQQAGAVLPQEAGYAARAA